MKLELISTSVNQTQQIASIIGKQLFQGAVITLDGDLGAGKTTFTQGIGLSLGVKEQINSPTFNILKCYFSGRLPLYHVDAYRLEDGINSDIGLEEVIQGDGVCLIEWSIFIPELIYQPLNISIEIIDENTRKLIFSTQEEIYQDIFKSLEALK